MKKTGFLLTAVIIAIMVMAFAYRPNNHPYGFVNGSPEIKSMTSLAFGPDGILFIGDSKGAAVFAVDTKDVTRNEKSGAIDLKAVDQKIAALLGTQAENVAFQDMAVNPVSKKVYLA